MKKKKSDHLFLLGKAIRERREALGISQEELAELADFHRTYIGGIERGERNVTLLSLIKLTRALQLTPHEILIRAGL
ncbi:MAG TPA: helix-turn-helix transcriptional regulator [bacterium]|nr:helix-turn-helix transcriptional regulator [bacterium]